MENLEKLLKEVSIVLQEKEASHKEKLKRAELFNIFSILQLSTSEVRLHSAFLAELLNPSGSHGIGKEFLDCFIDALKQHSITVPPIETGKAKIYIEKPVNGGIISSDGTHGGRLDIEITDDKHSIIIENKIDAEDQDKQLLRYWNYGEETYSKDNFLLLYLTRGGRNASDNSIGLTTANECNPDYKVKYHPISYYSFIVEWLEKCIRISAEKDLVRTTIRQYINNINQIKNVMDEKTQSIITTITSEQNVDATLTILSNYGSIINCIREKFIENLRKLGESRGLQVEIDEGLKSLQKDSWIRFYLPKSSKSFYIGIGWGAHTNNDGARYGLFSSDNIRDKIKELLDPKYLVWNEHGQEVSRPGGSAYLWSASGKKDSGRWWRWDDLNTAKDMANGKLLEYIKTEVLGEKAVETLKMLEQDFDNLSE